MNIKYLFVILILLLSGILGFTLSWHQHHQPIHVSQVAHYPALLMKQLAGDPQAGKKIFKEFCSCCHGVNPTIDIHAPSISNKKFWQAKTKLGIDPLLQVTITGKGAMPARGGCFECSDEQLREVIKWISEPRP